MHQNGPTILVVDDDEDDLFFITYAIQRAYPLLHTAVATNGTEALHYLERAKQNRAFPVFILLDINMPRMNGKETLSRIKADPQLASIPLVVFSTSALPSERLFCTHYGVEMVTKPDTFLELERVLQKILSHAVFP
jgi:CheY-like chemotaxis protein